MVENEENKTPKQLSHKQRHTTWKNICLWKNIFPLQVYVGISEAAAVSPSWINARILQLTVYVKRKHERGFRQKYTAQDFYEADKGKMKTEVLFEIRKIRFRCSVDWNRIDACNFFLSSPTDQLRCCSCSAVGDWLEQKCLCDAFITFTFSKWFYHCLEKSKKFHSVLLTFTKCFFIQHCLWKINFFLSVMHSSFYFRKMFFCCLGKKKIFFLSHNDFLSLVLKKNIMKGKIYFSPQSNIHFHISKKYRLCFLNKKLYLRVRTVFFTNAFITFHFSKCFFSLFKYKMKLVIKCPKNELVLNWGLSAI